VRHKVGDSLNVLFLTLADMENIKERGIYTDFVRELASKGINCYVVSPREKRTNLPTELTKTDNINLLKVKTGNITKTSFLEKGLSTLSIERYYLQAINKYFTDIRFDMVIYSTPPITFEKVSNYFKKKHKSKTYLMLKDIFPQNAVDMEVMKHGSILWRYFRNKEKKLYRNSDFIGCMSKGNMDYLLKHNSYLNKERVEIFPNAIKPVARRKERNKNSKLLEKYNLPEESSIFVYGGNLGKPQGIDFLITVINQFHEVDKGYLLIVGSGTEYQRIKSHIENVKPNNVCLLNKLPKSEYDQLLESADVGLIFLDKRFAIPNIPSRLTAYMEYSLPILAATDKNTDLKDILKESGSGFWVESGEINSFIDYARHLSLDKELRFQMGIKGREYLEENYDIRKTVNIILKHLYGDEDDV
jgi:glycosyltransferase involved in cell wall biosynthesis